MKRYLLFIISMLCVSIGTWAAVTYEGNITPDGGAYAAECGRFTTETAGDLNTDKSNLLTNMTWYKTIFIVGPVNEDDIKAMNDYGGSNDIIIDFTFATGLNAEWLSNITNAKITGLGLPDEFDLALTNSNLKVVYSTAATGAKTWGGDSKGGDSYKVNVLASGGLTQITDNYFKKTYYHKFRTFDVYGSANYTDAEMTEFKKLESIGAVTEIATYGGGDDPYIVSGCNVTIQMDKVASGLTLADQIALAKAQVSGSICTLTVTGEINDNDLIALGGTDMTGATRIDLSEATLASGSSIENMQIPAALTSLVLPKDQTVGVSLRSKLGSNSNLKYAYSPSSSTHNASQAIADYVWVNQAGGLWQAMEDELTLRTAVYVKVACDVAGGVRLNENDAKFGNHSIDASSTNDYPWQYVDLSETFFGVDATNANTAPHGKSYRIILPDNLTGDHMAIFASKPETDTNDDPDRGYRGKIAAVYSYSGTTLKLMEINDDSYHTDALADNRIVRIPSTDAIEVVTGTYNSTAYGIFGDPDGTSYQHLLDAINGAASCIKSVTLNNVHPQYDNLTFSNTNIETLQIIGARKHYSDSQGSAIDVTSCTKLKTLNITNSVVNSIDAHEVSTHHLQSVNLSGTNINGTGTPANGITNLSGCSALTAITTSSSTKFLGELDLASTGLTSFATTAEVTGDINLNACSSLTKIDISSTQFKNSTSKIHVHATDDESDTNVLSGLNAAGQKTIQVPAAVNNVEFDKTRIHPNDNNNSNPLDDNIAAAAASGEFELDDHCKIEYDGTTGIATVTATHPGCFSKLMYKSNNYTKFPAGTTFKFTSTCQLNENDLKSLCGYINENGSNISDQNYRSNYFYVDLYDVPASSALCDYQSSVITNTISWMRTNDRQFKGLILPKDHTLYGAGITLIQSENPKTQGELSTCSEFIAYFKTQDMVNNVATDLPKKILFTHVYNAQASNSDAIQASNDKLTTLLTAHRLNGAAENCPVDLYSVSTNGVVPFDASTLVGDKGYVETFNNEMVGPDTRANIYAYPSAVGEFTTFVDYSSIGVTTTEILKIDGTVSSDASAVAASINRFTNGPRVLDLTEINPKTDEFLSALLPALGNNNIEYIILPGGKSKNLVCNTTYSSSMTNLKAVISSTSTDLVAYVKQAGSLAEARYHATGGSTDGSIFSPTQTGLTSVTLAGNLNASDISANTTSHFLDENGHWKTTSGNQKSVALWGEQGTIATIDLKDAVFATQTDMNFSYAGLSSLHNITLPTSASMTLIPAECFMGITTFNTLCIPYNYTKIDNAALLDTYCGHITTTDANGALIDNGEHSYTFSANLEEIGSKPSTADANGVYSLDRVVFPQNRGVTDVYVLAHQVPKCYANAFPANMLYGWGGFKGGDFPYCREKYDNSSDGSMIFTVLHYPDEASYAAAATTDRTGSSYVEMEKLYTDINKVYTKKEQTGAVDANGDPVAWPTFAELRRAYNQATAGAQWYDWNIVYDGQYSINGGNFIPVGSTEYTVVPTGTNPNTSDVDYSFSDYEGWHQFVLSMASYVEPAKTVENDVIKTNYVQGAWYTLCIPFSLTVDQATELLGIPKSVNGKTENSYGGTIVNSDMLPDVRTLQTATRTPGTTNTVTLKFTQDLLSDGITRYWNINSSDADQSGYASTGSTSDGNAIAIRGGYPYLVRPYLPANVVVNNLGKYIMTRYGNKFEQARSCIYIDGCAQDLATYSSSQKTGRFAKPFEGHKIQAVWDDNDSSTPKYRTHSDGKNYNYTFVGQFWQQKLPRYSFYMVENSSNTNGKWYRLASDKSYKWNQYKCIIMVTPENTETAPEGRSYLYTNSGKFRNNDQTATTHSVYPESTGTDAQGAYKFDSQLYIEFLNGLDDSNFDEAYQARYVITFDDFIQDIDEDESSTTSIDSLDGETINKRPTNGKVYNLSGQLVGNSIDGLEKGMYIVNGKKYIVR